MVCSSCVRSLGVQAGTFAKRVKINSIGGSSLQQVSTISYWSGREFKKIIGMMVDTDSMSSRDGPFLDNVTTEKDDNGRFASGGWKSEDGRIGCGYSSFRGKRVTMEDFYDIKTLKTGGRSISLFGIFDGHGGSRAAEYLKDHLFDNLVRHPKFLTDAKLALSETYQQTDADFLNVEKDAFRDDGSTASTAVLVDNHLYVANVGDSRTIISKAGKAIALSEDHKPNRSDERKRIENAGGVVMWAGTWRVGGVLAMSRAFGNRMLKPFVVAEPEIQDQEIDEQIELLILASDGLWDVVQNDDAVSLARTEEEPEAAARKLTEAAFSRGSADNITCIVVRFHHDKADFSNPEKADLSNPDKADLSNPEKADPSNPDKADLSNPDKADLSNPDKAESISVEHEQTK